MGFVVWQAVKRRKRPGPSCEYGEAFPKERTKWATIRSSIVVPSLYSRFDYLVLYYAVKIFLLCAAELLSGSFFSVATVDTAVDTAAGTAVGTAVGTAGLINGIVPVHDVARFIFVRGVCLVLSFRGNPLSKVVLLVRSITCRFVSISRRRMVDTYLVSTAVLSLLVNLFESNFLIEYIP